LKTQSGFLLPLSFVLCWRIRFYSIRSLLAYLSKGRAMWTDKTFKTRESMAAWISKNGHKYQWEEIFINNGYGVTFKPLRVIF
jgi:hypothetical protein